MLHRVVRRKNALDFAAKSAPIHAFVNRRRIQLIRRESNVGQRGAPVALGEGESKTFATDAIPGLQHCMRAQRVFPRAPFAFLLVWCFSGLAWRIWRPDIAARLLVGCLCLRRSANWGQPNLRIRMELHRPGVLGLPSRKVARGAAEA